MPAWSRWVRCYGRTLTAFKRDDIRWLNTVLATGLVAINLVAFSVTYWLATRDIMAEYTGEVVAGPTGAPRPRNVRDVEAPRSLKQSSLSKNAETIVVDEESDVSMPLPPPRLNASKSLFTRPAPTAPASPRLAEGPLASPDTAPLTDPDTPAAPAPAPAASAGVESGRSAQSP